LNLTPSAESFLPFVCYAHCARSVHRTIHFNSNNRCNKTVPRAPAKWCRRWLVWGRRLELQSRYIGIHVIDARKNAIQDASMRTETFVYCGELIFA
jgi:hypothetical protein